MTTATVPEARPHEMVGGRLVKTSLPRPSGPAPLATFLGLFSIGLGLWEVTNPRGVANRTGVHFPGVLRAYGAREIMAGLGILRNERPAFWLWNRVAGDTLDLATIAAAYARGGPDDRRKALEAAAAVFGVNVLDVLCACEHSCDSK